MKTIITFFAAVLLAACQPAPEPQIKTYTEFSPSTKDRVTIQVVWLDEPSKYCALRNGTPPANHQYLGCSAIVGNGKVCEVVMAHPKNFNDNLKLEVLGHELMHCLGARHE
jgi:hypothetical protein